MAHLEEEEEEDRFLFCHTQHHKQRQQSGTKTGKAGVKRGGQGGRDRFYDANARKSWSVDHICKTQSSVGMTGPLQHGVHSPFLNKDIFVVLITDEHCQ